jgi:hypothetical protein
MGFMMFYFARMYRIFKFFSIYAEILTRKAKFRESLDTERFLTGELVDVNDAHDIRNTNGTYSNYQPSPTQHRHTDSTNQR